MGRKLLEAFWATRTVWVVGPVLLGMAYVRFFGPIVL